MSYIIVVFAVGFAVSIACVFALDWLLSKWCDRVIEELTE